MFFLLSFWVDGLPAGLTCSDAKNQRMYFSDFRLELGTPYVSTRNLECNEKPNKELIKIIQEFFFHFFLIDRNVIHKHKKIVYVHRHKKFLYETVDTFSYTH